MDDVIKKAVDYCFTDMDELLPAVVLAELDRVKNDEKRLDSLTLLCIRKIMWDWIWPRSTAGIHLKLLFKEPVDISRASQAPLYFLFFEANPIEDPRCFKNDANLMMKMMESSLTQKQASSMSFYVYEKAFQVKLDGVRVVNVEIENFDVQLALAFGKLAVERGIHSLEFILGVNFEEPTDSTDKEMEFANGTMKKIMEGFPEAVLVEGWGEDLEKRGKETFYVVRAECNRIAPPFSSNDSEVIKHVILYRMLSFYLHLGY